MTDDIESTRTTASRTTGREKEPRFVLRLDTGYEMIIDGPVIIGREPALAGGGEVAGLIALDDPSSTVSKSHLRLDPRSDGVVLTDRHSTNGVAVVGPLGTSPCEPGRPTEVPLGVTITFGDRSLAVHAIGSDSAEQVEHTQPTLDRRSGGQQPPAISAVAATTNGSNGASHRPVPPLISIDAQYRPTVPESAPPQIWCVCLGLLAVAVLLIFPVFQLGTSSMGELFSPNATVRAFGALISFAVVSLAGLALALGALGIGMLRGSQVSQWLTIVLATVIAVSELSFSTDDTLGVSRRVVAIVAMICVAIVVLIMAPVSSRAFFRQDDGRPTAVLLATAIGVYLGWVGALGGVLLMLAGAEGVKYVWWGLLFVAIGSGLAGSARSVRLGSTVGRGWMTVTFLGDLIINFVVAGQGGSAVTSGTVVLTVIVASGLVALWVPASSTEFFIRRTEDSVDATGWRIALGGLMIMSLVVAVIGFKASANASTSGGDFAQSQETTSSDPTSDPPTYATLTQATEPSGPAVAATVDAHDWTVTETGDGGYSLSIDLSVGLPQHMTSGLTNGMLTAGSACTDIDQQADAVIPAVVSVTNDTAGGFSTTAAYALNFGSSWNGAEAEVGYTAGADCISQSTINTNWQAPFSSGQAGVSDIFFVLHNYYTPNFPGGDPSVLAAATVAFTGTSGTAIDGSASRIFTPGEPRGSDVQDGTIPLGG